MSDTAKWLAGLKVGDPVVVRTNFPRKIARVRRIARFTKTLIVTDDGWRFRRKNGHTPGESWPTHWIEKPTAAQARKAGG